MMICTSSKDLVYSRRRKTFNMHRQNFPESNYCNLDRCKPATNMPLPRSTYYHDQTVYPDRTAKEHISTVGYMRAVGAGDDDNDV